MIVVGSATITTPGAAEGRMPGMAVTDFDTKVAVIVRDDLAAWQRLNVCAFLMSGVTAAAGPDSIGADYTDADGNRYLPLLVQPVVIFQAAGDKLQTVRERAARREVPIALYTAGMFATGNDTDNRAVVRSVTAAELDIVGIGVRAAHRDADAILRGLTRHP
jgi:hypothetical protein